MLCYESREGYAIAYNALMCLFDLHKCVHILSHSYKITKCGLEELDSAEIQAQNTIKSQETRTKQTPS